MLTVHHLGVSQSERIVWLCEELGLDYELKRYDRDPQTRLAPAAYKALHPMGTAPVITDGTVVMSESGAIVEYILARYGKGRLAVGPEQPNFADYVFWLHFANGSMMPHELIRLICSMLGQTEEAIAAGERATQLLPISADALDGTLIATNLAAVYAQLGRHEDALALLETLVSQIGGPAPGTLRVEPQWDYLRDHPRFQRLLAS